MIVNVLANFQRPDEIRKHDRAILLHVCLHIPQVSECNGEIPSRLVAVRFVACGLRQYSECLLVFFKRIIVVTLILVDTGQLTVRRARDARVEARVPFADLGHLLHAL